MNGAARSSSVHRGPAASVILLVVFLAAWQWGPGLLGIPPYIVPSLSMVAQEFAYDWQVSHLLLHTGVTAGEVLAGFVLGSLLGAFVGYVLGMSPTAELALSPYILALQIAPKVAFRTAVHLVDGLYGLSENPGGDPDRVLPGHGQRLDRDPRRRSGFGQSRARLQGNPRADFLEGRISGVAAADVCRAAHRLDLGRRRRGCRRTGRRQCGAGLSAQLSARARPTRRWCSSRS